MPSRPASQLADDGEAVGTPVPAAYDPSSAEPPVTHGGARKSVAPAPDGREANGYRKSLLKLPEMHSHKSERRAVL